MLEQAIDRQFGDGATPVGKLGSAIINRRLRASGLRFDQMISSGAARI